jgi:hypothetical protein
MHGHPTNEASVCLTLGMQQADVDLLVTVFAIRYFVVNSKF